MRKLLRLLTAFSGRISRAQFWLALVLLIVLTVAGLLLVNPASLTSEGPVTFAENVVALVSFWPMMAITIKRLNDRDWPSWLGIVLGSAMLPAYIGPFFGLLDPVVVGHGTESLIEIGYILFFVAIGVFLLVDNGFLRGTDGPNRYGPDPLKRSTAG